LLEVTDEPEREFDGALLCSDSHGQVAVIIDHLQTYNITRCQQVIGPWIEGRNVCWPRKTANAA